MRALLQLSLFLPALLALHNSTRNVVHRETTEISRSRMGPYVLIPARRKSELDSKSCFHQPFAFLKRITNKKGASLDPMIVAKMWMKYNQLTPNMTFFGAPETISVFREGQTLNVLVDTNYSVNRFILRNLRNGEINLMYKTEDEMLKYLATDERWKFWEVLECQHLLFYLSKTFGAYRASFFVMKKGHSASEDEAIKFTGGLGTLSKWEKLGKDGKVIASALYEASEGKVTKLASREWHDKSNVWAKALQILFPGQPTDSRDAFLLWSLWIGERKGIYTHYETLRGKPFNRSQKSTQIEGSKTESHCFCQRSYKRVKNVPMIQCDACKNWYHGLCQNVKPEEYEGSQQFVCEVCSGASVIPPIFRETPQSSPATQLLSSGKGHEGSKHEKVSSGSLKPENVQKKPETSPGLTNFVTPKLLKSKSSARMSGLFKGIDPKPPMENNGTEEIATNKSSDEEDDTFDNDEDQDSDAAEFSSRHHDREDEDNNTDNESVSFVHEVDSSLVLEDEIEQEARKQDADNAKLPMSKHFVSSISLNVLDDEEDDFEIKNPVSPKKSPDATKTGPESDSEDNEDEKQATHSDDEDEDERRSKDVNTEDNSDKQISEDESEVIDTSSYPTEFHKSMPFKMWRSIIRTKKDDELAAVELKKEGKKIPTYTYVKNFRIDKEYTNVFSEIFDTFNHTCIMGFNNKRLRPDSVKAAFFRAYGECTKKPRDCPAKYNFYILETPDVTTVKDVVLHIDLMSDSGPVHRYGTTGHRRHHGDILHKVRNELKTNKAATVRSNLMLKADQKSLETGKLNVCKTLTALRQSRAVKKKEDDHDADPVKDILATKVEQVALFPDKILPGYVQEVSVFPVRIIMYTKLQFDLLLRTTRRFGPRTLQLDATGTLTRNLKSPYDTRAVLLTTIIMRSPSLGEQVLPIAEMLSSDGTVPNISYFLRKVLESYRQTCNVKAPFYGIERLEIDFSKANVASIIRIFSGVSVAEYMDQLWKAMIGKLDPKTIFPVHVCRFHVTRALESYVTEGVGEHPDAESNLVVRKWIHRFTHAHDLWDFHRLCRDAAFLFGQMYVTQSLHDCIDGIDEPTLRGGQPPWHNFMFEDAKNLDVQFYKRSPFGSYADEVFTQMESRNKSLGTSGKNYQFNPLYDPVFLRKLKLHYMPYFPIASHAVLEVTKVKTTGDTTNAIEQYHGLLKTNIYEGELREAIPRFLRKQGNFIKSSCFTQIAALAKFSRRKPKTSQPTGDPYNQNDDDEGHASEDEETKEKNKGLSSSQGENPNKKGSQKLSVTRDLFGNKDEVPKNKELDRKSDDEVSGKAKQITTKSKSTKTLKFPFDKSFISPDSDRDDWRSKSQRKQGKLEVQHFDVPLVKWGGQVKLNNETFPVSNSCAMDTTLQILVALYMKNEDFKEFLDESAKNLQMESHIKRVISLLMKNDINNAKTIWMVDVLGLSRNEILVNTFHSEREFGWEAFKHWFPSKRYFHCSNDKCGGNADSGFWPTEVETILDLRPYSVDHFLCMVNRDFCGGAPCTACESKLRVRVEFSFNNMPFIMYAINENGRQKSTERYMRYTQTIKGERYTVFAYTILENEGTSSAHYLVKFVTNYNKIIYNGLSDKPKLESQPTNEIVTSVWLVRSA